MHRAFALDAAERRHFYRRVAIAPLCLCLVAGLHAARVVTARQTPWKGGGFGMFSTVDGPGARFLRCYLLTEQGALPLPLPAALDKRVAEIQAAPSQQSIDALAQRLASQRWRWREMHEQQLATRVAARAGNGVSTDVLRGSAACPNPAEFAASTAPRTIEPAPLDEAGGDSIAFHAVRVECWAYAYDREQHELRARRLLAAEVRP